MNEVHVCSIKQIYSQLNNILQFSLSRILEDFLIAEINKREKRNEVLNKYTTAFDCVDNTCLFY